jgi:hypothetical protein
MTTLDLLWLVLAVGFLILVGFLSFASYQFGLTLKSLRLTVDETRKIVRDIESLESGLRLGLLGVITWFLNRLKGGGANGHQ